MYYFIYRLRVISLQSSSHQNLVSSQPINLLATNINKLHKNNNM